jgi:hypothetical protein
MLPVWLVEPKVIDAKPSLNTAASPLHNEPGSAIAHVTAVVLLAHEAVLMPMVFVAVKGMSCNLPLKVLERSCAPEVKIRLSA